MLPTILSRVFVLSLVVALSSLAAQADPITVWGSGSNINTGAGTNFVFNFDLQGNNLAVHFATLDTSNPIGCCTRGGQPFWLDFNGSGYDVVGSLVANGVTYPFPTALGGILIHAQQVIAPATPTLGLFHVTTPFAFSGWAQGYDDIYYSHLLASYNLVGGGFLDAVIFGTEGDINGPIYSVRTVTYTFQTPEPASILLLFSGLSVLVFRRRIRT